jgi:hypothetical protein
MSELKMLEMSQTLETHKKGIESQVTSHSENPTLHTGGSRCRETCWRFRGRSTRGQGGRTRPWANHTFVVGKIFLTLDYSSTFRLMYRLETFVDVFSKEEVDTLLAFVSTANICFCTFLPIQVTWSCL